MFCTGMRINFVSSVQINKVNAPYFTSTSGRSAVDITKCDNFNRTICDNFDQKFEVLYDKMSKNLGIVTTNDVEGMAETIRKKVGDISIEDVYYAMAVLSEYSSYESWNKLEYAFDRRSVSKIVDLTQDRDRLNGDLPICLTSVMGYLNAKYRVGSYSCNNSAVILDSKLLDVFEKNPEIIKVMKNFDPNMKFIYVENFENGYNFLNQAENFQDFAVEIIKKSKNAGGDFRNNLYKILNNENLKRIKDLGIHPDIIKAKNYDSWGANSFNITKQLNPIIMDKSRMKEFFRQKFPDCKFFKTSDVADFFEDFSVLISPRQLALDIKNLHEKLSPYINDSTYFLIPQTDKSFGLINYMYQNINGIGADRYLYNGLCESRQKDMQILKMPEGTNLIVIDDCAMSGMSLCGDPFWYKTFISENPNTAARFVISPLYATKEACKRIGGVRESDVVLPNKMLKEMPNDLPFDLYESHFTESVGENITSSIIFPYMGPDTNIRSFKTIYNEMLPTPYAQKSM